MDVVFDSSVILEDPWFESQGMRMLLDHVHKVQGNVVLLDVVEAEVTGVMERRVAAALDELEKAHQKARRTRIPKVPLLEREGLADQCLQEWRAQLRTHDQGITTPSRGVVCRCCQEIRVPNSKGGSTLPS